MAVETIVPEEDTSTAVALHEEAQDQVSEALPETQEQVESADETTGAEASPETEVDSGLDPELASQAQQLGLDPNVFGGPDNLQTAMRQIQLAENRRLMEIARQMQQAQQGYQTQQGQSQQQGYQPQGQQLPGAPAQTGAAGFQQLDLDKLLPADKYDEDVRGAFKALNDHYSQQFAPVQQFAQALPLLQQRMQEVEQLRQYVQQQSEAQFWNEFDGYFNSQEPEWQAVFGKGPSAALPANSPQRLAREKMLGDYQLLAAAKSQIGQPFTSVQQVLDSVRPISFAKESESIQRKKLAGQLKSRNGQALARPSSKQPKAVSGVKSAVEASKEFDQKFGLVE